MCLVSFRSCLVSNPLQSYLWVQNGKRLSTDKFSVSFTNFLGHNTGAFWTPQAFRHATISMYREHIPPQRHLVDGDRPMDVASIHSTRQARDRYGVGDDLPSQGSDALWEQRAVATDWWSICGVGPNPPPKALRLSCTQLSTPSPSLDHIRDMIQSTVATAFEDFHKRLAEDFLPPATAKTFALAVLQHLKLKETTDPNLPLVPVQRKTATMSVISLSSSSPLPSSPRLPSRPTIDRALPIARPVPRKKGAASGLLLPSSSPLPSSPCLPSRLTTNRAFPIAVPEPRETPDDIAPLSLSSQPHRISLASSQSYSQPPSPAARSISNVMVEDDNEEASRTLDHDSNASDFEELNENRQLRRLVRYRSLHNSSPEVLVPSTSEDHGWPALTPRSELVAEARRGIRMVLGVDSAREKSPEQLEAIVTALKGEEDFMVVLPTGGGKSMIWQALAKVRPAHGSIIVEPLVALLDEQLKNSKDMGILSFHYTVGRNPPIGCQNLFIQPETGGSVGFKQYVSSYSLITNPT